jgi:hypothetical protein
MNAMNWVIVGLGVFDAVTERNRDRTISEIPWREYQCRVLSACFKDVRSRIPDPSVATKSQEASAASGTITSQQKGSATKGDWTWCSTTLSFGDLDDEGRSWEGRPLKYGFISLVAGDF